MKKKYEVTTIVEIDYDDKKIQDTLNDFREVIYKEATLDQLLIHIAGQLARGNHGIEGIGDIYDYVGYNYWTKNGKELPPIWWIDIDVDEIKEI